MGRFFDRVSARAEVCFVFLFFVVDCGYVGEKLCIVGFVECGT